MLGKWGDTPDSLSARKFWAVVPVWLGRLRAPLRIDGLEVSHIPHLAWIRVEGLLHLVEGKWGDTPDSLSARKFWAVVPVPCYSFLASVQDVLKLLQCLN